LESEERFGISRALDRYMDQGNGAQDFLRRLDSGELDGKLFQEMTTLSYEQLLHVGGWLAERHVARVKGKRVERAFSRFESLEVISPSISGI
jgi:hypothetical protein